jgi:hypothetical protein
VVRNTPAERLVNVFGQRTIVARVITTRAMELRERQAGAGLRCNPHDHGPQINVSDLG